MIWSQSGLSVNAENQKKKKKPLQVHTEPNEEKPSSREARHTLNAPTPIRASSKPERRPNPASGLGLNCVELIQRFFQLSSRSSRLINKKNNSQCGPFLLASVHACAVTHICRVLEAYSLLAAPPALSAPNILREDFTRTAEDEKQRL